MRNLDGALQRTQIPPRHLPTNAFRRGHERMSPTRTEANEALSADLPPAPVQEISPCGDASQANTADQCGIARPAPIVQSFTKLDRKWASMQRLGGRCSRPLGRISMQPRTSREDIRGDNLPPPKSKRRPLGDFDQNACPRRSAPRCIYRSIAVPISWPALTAGVNRGRNFVRCPMTQPEP